MQMRPWELLLPEQADSLLATLPRNPLILRIAHTPCLRECDGHPADK